MDEISGDRSDGGSDGGCADAGDGGGRMQWNFDGNYWGWLRRG